MLQRLVIITVALVALVLQLDAIPFLHNSNLRPSKLIKNPEYEQPIYFDETQTFNETDSNEATPGFLQKKLEKIVAKLQYFTSLTSTDDGGEEDSGAEELGNSGVANATENVVKSQNIQKIENPKKSSQEKDQKVEAMESSIVSQILSPVVSLAFRIFSAAGGGSKP